MQRSDPPNSAMSRVSPATAAQPVPGTSLLQAFAPWRKYGQRVRWRTLPPTVAALRSCCRGGQLQPFGKSRVGSEQRRILGDVGHAGERAEAQHVAARVEGGEVAEVADVDDAPRAR